MIMVKNRIDWLTFSCLTSKDITVFDLLDEVLKTLCLDDIRDRFTYVGRDKYYAEVHRYNDISILLCKNTPQQLIRQGICVKCSSNGLAFFYEHLAERKTDLRTVCKRWRAISVNGFFTRCTRFDYTIDNICKNEEKPFITMDRVKSSVRKHQFVSQLTVERSPQNALMNVGFDCSHKGDELEGDTVYFGRRKGSSVLCRFYDKILEQKFRKQPLDDDITSWVRCEFEFHNDRSQAAFNAFCDMSDDDFADYMAKVFNKYISFVYRDDSNTSRCTIKKWWSDFLGTSEKAGLIIPPYKAASFSSTQNWLNHSVFPTLAYFVKCVGLTRFLKMLGKFMHKKPSPRIQQMVNDYEILKKGGFKYLLNSGYDDYASYIKERGLDPWLFTGSVSAADLKADFANLCDWSKIAVMLQGDQLLLMSEDI